MALDLSFSVTERNDNLVITITDTTGTYDAVTNDGGWETGGATNPDPADIVASGGAHTLELTLTITTSSGTSTTYDDVDLYTQFGPFTDAGDLVFALTPAMFSSSGTALGTAIDEFPDGIYEFTYKYDDGLGGQEDSQVETALIEGKVKNATYELLRLLPKLYECKDCVTKKVLDAIFCRGYLDAMYSSAYISNTEELYNQLYVLERLVTDGSSYTWR